MERNSTLPFVGESAPARELYETLRLVAPSSATVLIVGESGTGKELVARTLHQLSTRRDEDFVAVNASAIPENLLESEMFGCEKGAFTGAIAARRGCLELADRGTLFLDEVAEMSPQLQVKLLRALEERSFRRLGGQEEIRVDLRLVAATNRKPAAMLETGALREDLYYRLNVFTLEVPPLRERREDIPLLAAHFLDAYAREEGKTLEGLSEEALSVLRDYAWPGNVRELRNAMERAAVVASGPLIDLEDLPPELGGRSRGGAPDASEHEVNISVGTTVEEAKRRLILKTLEATGYDKTRAARILGITSRTIHNKLNRWGRAPSKAVSGIRA